mmetsp:Transcript_120728/g.341413  ORF Transcript_120728/g.341413 Transcript_120728/m.341413 type:complete len:358 (-) Transcript_120728:119-1192(-)
MIDASECAISQGPASPRPVLVDEVARAACPAHGGHATRLFAAENHRAAVAAATPGLDFLESLRERLRAVWQRVEDDVAGVRNHNELVFAEPGDLLADETLLLAPAIPFLPDAQKHDRPTCSVKVVDVSGGTLREGVALVNDHERRVGIQSVVPALPVNGMKDSLRGLRRASAIPVFVQTSLHVVHRGASRESDGPAMEACVGIPIEVALEVASLVHGAQATASHPVGLAIFLVMIRDVAQITVESFLKVWVVLGVTLRDALLIVCISTLVLRQHGERVMRGVRVLLEHAHHVEGRGIECLLCRPRLRSGASLGRRVCVSPTLNMCTGLEQDNGAFAVCSPVRLVCIERRRKSCGNCN